MNDVLIHIAETGVATVTINRPEHRNAFTMATVEALTEAFSGLAGDQAIRAVILTGAGRAFSAGGDLTWMRGVLQDPDGLGREGAAQISRLLQAIDTMPCPVVARINGPAFGGGFGLICAADIAIASTAASFGLSEVRLGVVPGSISPFVLRRLGPAAVRAFCLTGAALDTQTALRTGLVHRAVPPEELDLAVAEVMASILQSSPVAIAISKRLVRQMSAAPHEDWVGLGLDAITTAWKTEDAREGIGAFLEKRAPSWSVTP